MANADASNKKSKITFSGPVQVPGPHTGPGVITLPAGTYVFKLVSSSSNRNIVEVMNLQQNKVFATILAINDYRVNASSKTVMYFSERKAGSPVAVKSWFYPGDNYGQRFVYPKVQATQIAAAVKQPVPSTTEVVEVTKYVAVPVYIQTPAKQEVAYDVVVLEKTDATDTSGDDGEAVKAPAAEAPKALPKTASSLPLVGLSGLLLLAFSLLVRRAASQLR
ncbi:MAG: hypothetical protein HY821_03645 [Acidobacteria bacterium]|nr:hypothetical protein [Acidobacteriota bacterium]